MILFYVYGDYSEDHRPSTSLHVPFFSPSHHDQWNKNFSHILFVHVTPEMEWVEIRENIWGKRFEERGNGWEAETWPFLQNHSSRTLINLKQFYWFSFVSWIVELSRVFVNCRLIILCWIFFKINPLIKLMGFKRIPKRIKIEKWVGWEI